jgi:PKD repeat protein
MKIKLFIFLLFFCATLGYPNGISIVSPVNNFTSPTFKPVFSWNSVLNATTYRLRIAQDPNFTLIIKDTVVTQTTIPLSFNASTSVIYWKVLTNAQFFIESPVYRLSFINPSQNNNLLLWLAADSNVVMQPDSTIDSWNNIIPNGLSAVQSSSSSKPKLVSNISEIGNNKAVRLDGIDDFLQINSGGKVGNSYLLVNWRGSGTVFPTYNGLLTRQSAPVNSAYFFTAIGGTSQIGYTNGNYYNGNIFINNVGTNFFAPLIKYKVLSGRRIATLEDVPNFTLGRDPNFSNGAWSWNGDVAELIISKRESSISESDSIHTYLYNKYSPPVSLGKDIIAGTSFTDSILLDPGNRFVSYSWPHNGSSASTVKVATGGAYTVKTKDIFGFDTEDEVQVYPYKRLNNITVYFCIGDSLKLDLGITSPFSFKWFKDNIPTGNTTSKITIKNTGLYAVEITDFKGKTIADTLNVVIDAPNLSPAPDLSNNLRVCLNEKLFLATSTAYDSIRWSTGSTDNFIAITAPGPYTVYGRTTAGCIINKSFNVTIAGEAPVAKFVNSSICQNTQTAFTDSSTSSVSSTITNWKWTFGDNNTSVLKNPNNTYTNLGTYTVGFKVTTNQGCSDSISKTIIVNRKPTPSFYNLLSCSGIATTFVDQTIPNSAAVTNWAWDFGLGQSNGIQNPSFSFPGAGVYNVKLTATNSNGCSDTITLPTTVNASPVSNFSFDSVCGKTPVSFKFLASVASPSFIPDISWGSWDFGDGNIETAIRNPQHIYQTPGTYDVSLFVRSSDQCVDTVTKRIKVFDFPIVDFTVSQTQCTGKEIQFTDISATPDGTPLTKWNWFFSGQATSEAQNPRYAFNAQGNYTVQLTARNAVGCTGTKLRSVAISAPPTPAFTFSPQNGLPPLTVNYFNQSPVNGNYLWDYGDGSPLVEGYNPPVHIYTEKGTFPIKLIATDFRGCTDTLTKLILVDKAFLDGVMASVSIIPNGEFYKIQVSVINNSNVEITALGLSLQLGGGAVIRENWTGSLLPGQTTVYLFTGEIKIGDNGQIPVICASIDNINNNAAEDRTDNNTSCKEVAVGGFDVLSVYPNPAYEVINFGVMLPKEGRVNIRFIDILGQQMYSKDFDGLKGYNSLSISTMQLNAAVYVAEVSYDGQVVRKKFMRKDRK